MLGMTETNGLYAIPDIKMLTVKELLQEIWHDGREIAVE